MALLSWMPSPHFVFLPTFVLPFQRVAIMGQLSLNAERVPLAKLAPDSAMASNGPGPGHGSVLRAPCSLLRTGLSGQVKAAAPKTLSVPALFNVDVIEMHLQLNYKQNKQMLRRTLDSGSTRTHLHEFTLQGEANLHCENFPEQLSSEPRAESPRSFSFDAALLSPARQSNQPFPRNPCPLQAHVSVCP